MERLVGEDGEKIKLCITASRFCKKTEATGRERRKEGGESFCFISFPSSCSPSVIIIVVVVIDFVLPAVSSDCTT